MKRLARWLLGTAIIGAAILVLGDGRDPWLWAYLLTFSAIGAHAMYSIDDDLAKERFTPPSAGADRLALRWVRLVALAHLIAGVADSRFEWTSVPPVLRAIGLAGFALSFLLIVHAMRANRFFSAVVRIQDERGHRVIDSGPYAIVRHPGYAGMILFAPFSGLALGSWISVAVGLAYSALVLRRVWFEDAFLRTNLSGYENYTQRVRYRLVPRVW
jgi:protein-S-isoprenylcysteine O-methyltransferase Ste14